MLWGYLMSNAVLQNWVLCSILVTFEFICVTYAKQLGPRTILKKIWNRVLEIMSGAQCKSSAIKLLNQLTTLNDKLILSYER